MPLAMCTKCGKFYHWRNRRGYRLADFPSPCCKAPGRATKVIVVQDNKNPLKREFKRVPV